MTDLYTVDELATYLKVPKDTLYMWRKTGKGPVGARVGKYIRYDSADVAAWLDSQKGI